ncbi:M48 family metallopeptidase [Brumimicrobium mesophilum]|uniref:M48 family metallopeptidase n=1 Tax=Brumimicrobium mesophilum TaxID=392717 RepID=UPI00131C1B9C|nr:M48 family metallopeptidase [Brumimicrobium mesophilum]
MKNTLTLTNRPESTFNVILTLLFVLSGIFLNAQENIFNETKNIDISNHFKSSEELKNDLYYENYGKLHRKEGYLIGDVLKQGSLFNHSLKKSGAVNFNSEATEYLNQIKSLLLQDYPSVNNDIQIFITHDNSVNAFATVNKDIFINVGLLAKIKSEAQLAFIISHEIMHVINDHIISKQRTIKDEIDNLDKADISINNDYLKLFEHQMGLDAEYEADINGLHLYLKTNYSKAEAIQALNMLKTSNQKVYDDSFDESSLFIDADLLIYCKETIKENLNELKSSSDDAKTSQLSSHPDIDLRIDTISVTIEKFNNNNTKGSQFLISKEFFNSLSLYSKLEMLEIYKSDFDFISTYNYASYYLKNSTNEIVKEDAINSIAYAIYGLIVDKKNSIKLNTSNISSYPDELLSTFYEDQNEELLAEWGVKILDSMSVENNSATLAKYKGYIQELSTKESDRKSEESKSLNLTDYDFLISPFTEMINTKNYTSNAQFSGSFEGKIAMSNYNTTNLQVGLQKFNVNVEKSEKQLIRGTEAISQLAENYPDKIISLIPNPQEYSGDEYNKFNLLNKWLQERFYFDAQDYTSMYQDEINKLIKEDGIEFVMANLQVDIKTIGLLSIMKRFYPVLFVYQYFPQLVMNSEIGKYRTYKLTIMFRLVDGELALWDTRTSQQPQTTAQVYLTFQDIINDLNIAK